MQEWHISLDHPFVSTMKYMKILNGKLLSETIDAIKSCEVCIKAKQTKNQFPILNRRTEHLFDLVHADL